MTTASGSTSPAHPSVPRLPAPRVHRKIRSFRPPKQERFSTTAHVIRALNDETYDQSILTQANLAKICGMLPKWITFPEKDRVPWLNRAAQQWWPFLNRAISNSVVDAVEPILNKLVQGSPFRNLHFSKFTLGTEPLVFASVACVDDVEDANSVAADVLSQATAALTTAVADGSFLATLQTKAAEESAEAAAAFSAVVVDVAATQTAIADAVL